MVFCVSEHGADMNVPTSHSAQFAHTVLVVGVQLTAGMKSSGHTVQVVQLRSVVAVGAIYWYSSASHT